MKICARAWRTSENLPANDAAAGFDLGLFDALAAAAYLKSVLLFGSML
jgi:hypothetical protein